MEQTLKPLHRISVADAAKVLGMCPDSVRYMVKKGTLPIGKAMEGRGRTTYYLYREFLEDYMEGRQK
ncbi:MAG: helix-turn-helix domain-containing protein [Butyrivibrio sp.]|nr:helix-turn-helix domain-containing protein [Butyrivibrio sp.]